MKRDDFGMRIDNVRELATKYSKPELARMVQMGMVTPQEALMAGMMIDRIAKSAMQPPQTTVAQDVLAAAPTGAQAGIMGAPNAPPPSSGVAALPSGMQNMAGGGIVAFAEGGDTDIPGYAGGVLTDSRNDPAMKIDPRVQAKRDRDRYQILAQELRDAQNRMMRGDPGAKSDFEAIQREMRSVKAAPSAGLTSFLPLPSAEAATPMAAKPAPVSAPAEEEAAYDPMTGLKITGPEPKPYDPRIKPGTVYEPSLIRDVLQGGPGAKPAEPRTPETAKPAPAAPSKFDVQPAPPRAPQAPIPEPAAPAIERPEKIQAEQIPVPEEGTFGEEYESTKEAYRQAGVDVDMYKRRMDELKGKKAGLAQKKEQALGAALMAFGLGLAGARKGQVMQALGSEGQKALGMYMNNMDKISENEDRIDFLNHQIALEENNFKRTGADSALARAEQKRKERQAIMAKNAELKQNASVHQATVGATLHHTDVWKQVTENVAAANVAAKMAAALGSNKGGFTDPQLSQLYDKVEMENRAKLEDLYKNIGSKEKIEGMVKDKLLEMAVQRAKEVAYIRQKGGIPVPSSGVRPWGVEGGVD